LITPEKFMMMTMSRNAKGTISASSTIASPRQPDPFFKKNLARPAARADRTLVTTFPEFA
jgi:hypothetical protein